MSAHLLRLVPGQGVFLRAFGYGDDARFVRLFRATWRRLPLSVRRRLLAYWRTIPLPPECPNPTIEMLSFWSTWDLKDPLGSLGECGQQGHEIRFWAPAVDRMPDESGAISRASRCVGRNLRCPAPLSRAEGPNMPKDPQGDTQDEMSPESVALVSATASAAWGMFADLRAALGDPHGPEMKISSPLIGYAAGKGVVWSRREIRRGWNALRSIFQRTDAEGLQAGMEAAADILEEGITLISDTPSEDKRRMIEEIIMNAARRAGYEGAMVEAEMAQRLVAGFTAEAAAVFAYISARAERREESVLFPKDGGCRGLGEVAIGSGINGLAKNQVNALIEDENSRHVERGLLIKLTVRGWWLRSWILAHADAVSVE